MKYVPRSCTQPRQRLGPIRFGVVNDRMIGRQDLDGPILVGDAARRSTFAGNGAYCASLNSNLLVLDEDRPAVLRVTEQPLVVGAQVLPPLVGADADDDGVGTGTGRPTPASPASIRCTSAPSCSIASGT